VLAAAYALAGRNDEARAALAHFLRGCAWHAYDAKQRGHCDMPGSRFSPHITHIVPDQISRLNLVAAELDVAIVAASLQRMNVDGVVYRRLKGAQLKIPLSLVSRRGETSEVVRQFLKMAKRTAKRF
jgi:DNA-binding transcriptional LysR family regulator